MTGERPRRLGGGRSLISCGRLPQRVSVRSSGLGRGREGPRPAKAEETAAVKTRRLERTDLLRLRSSEPLLSGTIISSDIRDPPSLQPVSASSAQPQRRKPGENRKVPLLLSCSPTFSPERASEQDGRARVDQLQTPFLSHPPQPSRRETTDISESRDRVSVLPESKQGEVGKQLMRESSLRKDEGLDRTDGLSDQSRLSTRRWPPFLSADVLFERRAQARLSRAREGEEKSSKQ